MKETKIEIPAGCEVEKIETQDGHVLVTFKELKPKLPKTWEEFCEMYPIKKVECSINFLSEIIQEKEDLPSRNPVTCKDVLPDYATAESVLTLCQLIQLRDCYNGDWIPDWEDHKLKYFIVFGYQEAMTAEDSETQYSPIYFKTEKLRDEFLRYFRPLIEKLKPLYGIKEGGEK